MHRELERIEMQSENNQMRFILEKKQAKTSEGKQSKKTHAVGGRNLGSSNVENNRCYNRRQVKYECTR